MKRYIVKRPKDTVEVTILPNKDGKRKARTDVDIALDDTTDQLSYAKTIIQDLLDNTDEYARQKAEDFLKESE